MTAKMPVDPIKAIHPRRMDFNFPDDIPVFWFDGSPFKTLLLGALSSVFPPGERFFVESVRYYREQIRDPGLKERVRGFIGQEAHHSKEHSTLNQFMAGKGMPSAAIENFALNGLKYRHKHMSPERQLAMTCALEHFTAILANQLLSHPEWFIDKMDSRVADIWAWHAVEETEHKAVAFDVYQELIGDYWIRCSQMAMTTAEFLFFTTLHLMQMLWASGQLKPQVLLKGYWELFGYKGILRGMLKDYLDYYRPDFHPWRQNNSVLLGHWHRRLGLAI